MRTRPQIGSANFTSVGLRREPQLGADRNTLADFDFHPKRRLFTIAVQVDEYGLGHQPVAHLDRQRHVVGPGAAAAQRVTRGQRALLNDKKSERIFVTGSLCHLSAMLVNDSRNAGCQPRTARRRDMTISPDQLLVPIPDACATLGGVSRTTVYALVNQDELVKVNIGRRGFITIGIPYGVCGSARRGSHGSSTRKSQRAK